MFGIKYSQGKVQLLYGRLQLQRLKHEYVHLHCDRSGFFIIFGLDSMLFVQKTQCD